MISAGGFDSDQSISSRLYRKKKEGIMFLQCTQIWKIIKRASKKASKRGKK
jgi:hypothetical protein